MPSRRTLLSSIGLGVAGLSTPVAARPATGSSVPALDVDVARSLDTVAAVSEGVTGHVEFAAVEALRELDFKSVDRWTTADLDRRLAPVFGRGPTRIAGLRSLAGEMDAGAAARRLGPGVSAAGTRLLADLAPGVEGPVAADRAALDTDAVTAVEVAADELGAVESFALGVDVEGSFRARVSGEAVTVAEARAVLRTLGLSASVVDGLRAADRDDRVTFDGSFERRDGEQPFGVALLLLLLVAVIATFVLGSGASQSPRVPQVSFSFRYEDGGPVTVVHRGGDSVEAGTLFVQYTVRGREPSELWPDADGDGFIEAGDS